MIFLDCPSPVKGKVTRTVSAEGRVVKEVVLSEEGSNVKGIVESRPSRVVAANLRLEAFS